MWPALLMQLSCLGRESVTRRMRGVGNEILVKEVGGGGVENLGDISEFRMVYGSRDNVRLNGGQGVRH